MFFHCSSIQYRHCPNIYPTHAIKNFKYKIIKTKYPKRICQFETLHRVQRDDREKEAERREQEHTNTHKHTNTEKQINNENFLFSKHSIQTHAVH